MIFMDRQSCPLLLIIFIFLTGCFFQEAADPSSFHEQVFSNEFARLFPDEKDGGYAWPQQVEPGDSVSFFLCDNLRGQKFEILKLKEKHVPGEIVETLEAHPSPSNNIKNCTASKGCEWTSTVTFTIPKNWTSALYKGSFHCGENEKELFFAVGPNPNQRGKILYLHDWTTLNAYNLYAGKNVYSYLSRKGLINMGSDLAREVSGEFSLARPLSPHWIEWPVNGSGPPKAHKKVLLSGLRWVEMLSSYPEKTDVMMNSFLVDMNQEEINRYKVIVVANMQEYLSHGFFEKIKAYILSGGYLIIAGNEFGFRYIRYGKNKRSFFSYLSVFNDPFLKSKPSLAAIDAGLISDLYDFFGIGFQHGIGFSFKKVSRAFEVADKSHQYFKGVNIEDAETMGHVLPWSPGTLLIEKSGRYCIQSSSIPCKDVSVLGFAKVSRDSEPITCCPRFREKMKRIWGDERYFRVPKNEFIYAPLMEVRKGKGRFLIVPHEVLRNPMKTNAKRFYTNVLDSVFHSKK